MKKISFKNKEEFKNFVISEAKKVIFEGEKTESKKVIKESVEKPAEKVTPANAADLANKMKELNKNLKFSAPVISENSKKIERNEDMSAYNKGKQVGYQKESEQDKWQRMLGYEVPADDKR